MREGWEPPLEEKPLISPKMWAMIFGLSVLFGKAFVEAMIGQTVQSFFSSKGGTTHEESITPSHTAGAAPIAASQTSWSAPPIEQEEEDPHQYAVQVYGTSSVIYPSTTIRVLNSGSFSDVGVIWDQPQEAQRKKRKR